jgi:UDPglucose--hexose-1-phosphate uridylyltransferase
MSDLRYDPVFDLWTAIAEIRRDRPLDFLPNAQSFEQLICPFCSGNEDETPPASLLLDQQGHSLDLQTTAGWSSRVIPNKYPTYIANNHPALEEVGPFLRSSMAGDQELVIPSPRHVISLAELTAEEFLAGLIASQHRIASKREVSAVQHAMLFGNCRYEAGASVAHVHFQLISSPIIPSSLQARARRFQESQRSGAHLLEQIVAFELEQQVRVVGETDDFVMVCPFASRFSFQVWIIPRHRPKPFWEASRESLGQIGELSQRYIQRIEELLAKPAYNWMLHQLPFQSAADDYWFVEIVPRVAKTAGYEMGTDIWINPVAPETASRRLKS